MTNSPVATHSPQRKNSLTSSLHLSYPILLLLVVIGLQNVLFFQKARWALRLAEKTHMFVVASFYYKTSKSFSPNTIAIVYAARKHAIDFPITCHSRDAYAKSHHAIAKTEMALVAPVQCKWTIMIALCPVIESTVEFTLEGDPGRQQMLPFQPADSIPRRFAVCMSRMFLFENWQLLISALEIYRHYGADLLVTYVESLLTDIHTILKAYEREGVLMVKPAVRLFKPDDINYDPNEENEWYNQDATYNSCLYEFKDSAEFILIADWDDVLVPNGHLNYIDEMYWLTEMHPHAAAFIFQRSQTTLHSLHSPYEFNLRGLIEQAEHSEVEFVTGKFVGRPERIDGIWLHAPSRVRSDYEVVELSPNHARVHHFRRWDFNGTNFLNRTSFLPGEDAERSFVQFIERNNLTQTFLNLPDSFPYYEELVACYRRMITLLDHNSLNACPSLPKCNLEIRSNHSCINLEQHYDSINLLNGFVLHYSSFNDYVETMNFCRTNNT
ncbi:Glycosyltransferase family 92 protein [Aphelenchoides besseyi]|nr:Glycosyltransferase family 92 protein [Aphelenchoides besseyi]